MNLQQLTNGINKLTKITSDSVSDSHYRKSDGELVTKGIFLANDQESYRQTLSCGSGQVVKYKVFREGLFALDVNLGEEDRDCYLIRARKVNPSALHKVIRSQNTIQSTLMILNMALKNDDR